MHYMRMLMSWPRAIFRFCAPSLLARLVAARVIVVSLSRPPHIVDQATRERTMQPVVDETMALLTSRGPKACDAASEWIQTLAAAAPEESESACRIHAEAGAMALASAALSPTRYWEPDSPLDGAFLVCVVFILYQPYRR